MRRSVRALAIASSALLVVASTGRSDAEGAPRLAALAREARFVVAGRVATRTTHGHGRIVVAEVAVDEVLKGGPLASRIEVVEMRDLPVPPVFVAGSQGVAFLRPATWTSCLAEALPPGTYYEPVPGHGAYVAGESAEEGKAIAAFVKRLIDASRGTATGAAAAKKARRLTFDLLAARHAALVGEGASRLGPLGAREVKLTEAEIDTLNRALGRTDLPSYVRVDLIRSVAAARIEGAVPALQRIEAPAEVLAAAWSALDALGSPPDMERIAAGLGSRAPALRAVAVRELLARAGVDAVSQAAPVVLQDPDEQVRIAAIEALGAVGKPEALPPLERAFAEQNGEVRQAAGRAILAVGGEPAADTFARLAFAAPPDAQRYAVVLLMTMGEDKNRTQIRRIAKTHPEEDVRRLVREGLPIHSH